MRANTDAEKITRLMRELGAHAGGAGDVFFTGGATAVLIGWRSMTIDVDLKFDPEPSGVFDVLPRLKEELDMNIELAAPDDFIPPLPDWRERSAFIRNEGRLRFFHYDLRAQCLAKIERGHRQDLEDARQMLMRGLVTVQALQEGHRAIVPGLKRYPAIDPDAFAQRIKQFLEQWDRE